MDAYRSIHVTVLPRRMKRCRKPMVDPIGINNGAIDVPLQSSIGSPFHPLSTDSSPFPSSAGFPASLIMKKSPGSSLEFGHIDRLKRNKATEFREKNEKRKRRNRKPCIILVVILLILLVLSGLAVGLYFIIHSATNTTTAKPKSTVELRWRPDGITLAGIVGSSGPNASQLNWPLDVAITSSNTFYVLEYYNHRVQEFEFGISAGRTVAGRANATPGTTSADLWHAAGLLRDANNNLYATDSTNCRVQWWSNQAASGTTIAGLGGRGSGNNQLRDPYGLAQDPVTKTLYIADYGNHRVISYPQGASTGYVVAGGNVSGLTSPFLSSPVGIYFDSQTNSLFIANFAAHNVVRWDLGANRWTLILGSSNGSHGNSSSMLRTPAGVTLDPMGNVYVTDTGNHRIQLLLAGASEATTILGTTGVSGASASLLNTPYAVQLDTQLNLYVADTINQRVQKFLRY